MACTEKTRMALSRKQDAETPAKEDHRDTGALQKRYDIVFVCVTGGTPQIIMETIYAF